MPENLESIKSEEIQKLLLESIGRGDCAILIGAGLSRIPGYPDLNGLLNEMARRAEIPELVEKEIDDGWMDDFQSIQEKIGEDRFFNILTEIFDPRNKNPQFDPILLNILHIPFCSYITTNYDPSIEYACRQLQAETTGFERHSFYYPNLPVTRLREKHIFHPHGYYLPEENSQNSIILTKSKYQEAYIKGKATFKFFEALFRELDVLFLGFGWSDMQILKVLRESKRDYIEGRAIAVQQGMPFIHERNKFTVIDRDTLERDKLNNDFISSMGIIPIVYDAPNGNHYELVKIIEQIRDQVADTKLGKLPSVPENYQRIWSGA